MQNSFFSPEPETCASHPFPPDSTPQDILAILWDKFYKWEYHENLFLLETLKAFPLELQPPYDDDTIEKSSDQHMSAHAPEFGRQEPESFEVVDYNSGDYHDSDPEPFTVVAIIESEPASRRVVRKWKPNPRYTTCTPLSFNIYNIRDDNNISQAPFAPFSDVPSFGLEAVLELYDRFAWQVDFKDPDHEVIKLETVRQLHFQQGLSFQEIDNLNLPSFPKILQSRGMVWEAWSQRDFLHWPESQMSKWPRLTLDYVLAHKFTAALDDIFSQVQLASTFFCPNLECLATSIPACQIHNVPGIREQKPTIATTEFAQGEYCSESCYRRIQGDMADNGSLEYSTWNDNRDLNMLKSFLNLSPDALPCDLAVICRKPCDWIYVNRKRIYPDENIFDERCTDPPSRFDIRTPYQYADIKNDACIPIPPCSHPGLCRKGVCSCRDSNYHCERNCRCGVDCKHRWEGCRCGHGTTKPCSFNTSCSCLEASRECDPELCLGCDAREAKKLPEGLQCRNNDIQQGRSQRIKISPSKWGYGAYAVTDIPSSAYLGDYVGEITGSSLSETAHQIEDVTRRFIGLNYAFSLYDETMIDSLRAGNETRYLNHGNRSQANCQAIIKTVHGTEHIVLITLRRIKAGEELLLDYGKGYWGHGQDKTDGESIDII